MSFLNRFSPDKEGNVVIQLELHKKTFFPEEKVEGVVHIEGGEKERKVKGVILSLLTETKGKIVKFGDYKVKEGFSLKPKEKKEIPITILLPEDVPTTGENQIIFFITQAVMSFSYDPRDKTYIKIHPEEERKKTP
jgi:sporulation-control protein